MRSTTTRRNHSANCWPLILPLRTPSSWCHQISVIGKRGVDPSKFRAHPFLSWIRGTRFSYTFYYPTPLPCTNPTRLSRSNVGHMRSSLQSHPIHASITALDHEAIDILSVPSSSINQAKDTHSQFTEYLARTKNTICGRHPIGVLLGALSALEATSERKATVKWVRYAQSSACETIQDSSVSYASAYVVI